MRLFKRKNDLKIMENYIHLTERVRDGAKLLYDVYGALLDLNYGRLDDVTKSIESIRDDTQAISKEIEIQLYKNVLIPTDKFIFFTLNEKIEKVMEKIIQTVRAISVRSMPLPGVNFLKDEAFKTYVEYTIQTAELLHDATSNLFTEDEERKDKNTVEICHSIEDLEKKIDDIKIKMLRDIHKMEKELEIYTILQIENIIHRIDEISDSAEDASDIIIMMHSLQSE